MAYLFHDMEHPSKRNGIKPLNMLHNAFQIQDVINMGFQSHLVR